MLRLNAVYVNLWVGGRDTHISLLRQSGDVLVTSLNMSPILYKKIFKHGSNFLTAQIFRFLQNPENHKICEKWTYFQDKILLQWVPFPAKMTLINE